MAARYLILLSRLAERPDVKSRITRLTGMRSAFEGHHISVLTGSDCPLTARRDDRGIVVGTIFDKATFRPLESAALPADEPLGCIQSYLIEKCWGRYVSVAQDADGTVSVMRDPSGGLPAYHLHVGGDHAIASDVETFVAAGLLRAEVDWDNIGFQFRFPNQRSPATALKGVRELLPGFGLVLDGSDIAEKPYWSPWDYIGSPSVNVTGDVGERLRRTVDGCIQALAIPKGRMLVGVSGGLDSSIIASALVRGHCQPDGVTVATDHPAGDERGFAREMCAAVGLPLHEAKLSIDHVDLRRPSAPSIPRPIGEPFLQSFDRIVREIARDERIDSLFRGNGGDAVFCFMQNASPIVDRLAAEGLHPAIWRTIRDVCKLTESSLGAVLRAALKRACAGPRSSGDHRDNRFLASEAGFSSAYPGHPWLATRRAVPPGRAAHVQWVVRVQRFAEGYAPSASLELICPLQAQPIVEHCLGIPSWEWVAGGINRSAVRRAYADVLPAATLKRTVKGGPEAFCIDLLVAYREVVREMLMDGLLAQNGILDRGAVERCLSYVGPARDNDHLRLLALVDAEAWARHWSTGAGIFEGAGAIGAT
jgi:asparagine synthase (glutamine-hydrolysing)